MRAKDLLPDSTNQIERHGVAIRKGTVGAFLANARLWSDTNGDPGQRRIAEQDMVDALPALRALGLFDIFALRDPALRMLLDKH